MDEVDGKKEEFGRMIGKLFHFSEKIKYIACDINFLSYFCIVNDTIAGDGKVPRRAVSCPASK